MSSVDELARRLKSAWDHPGAGGKVVEIHLFGVRNVELLKGIALPDLLARAGMADSYKTELRKAMNLTHFVKIR